MHSVSTISDMDCGLIIGIWLLTILAVSPGALQADAEEHLQIGEAAYRLGDLVSAISWYRKAAEQGHAAAQVKLARILDYSEANAEAVSWYQKAAEQGNAEAEFELAGHYASGDAVEKNLDQAMALFERAARRGHVPAIRVLAIAYESGGLERDIDHHRAVEWLERGVDAKDSWSIRRLAEAYREGQLGLARDPARAASVERRDTRPARLELRLQYDGL